MWKEEEFSVLFSFVLGALVAKNWVKLRQYLPFFSEK